MSSSSATAAVESMVVVVDVVDAANATQPMPPMERLEIDVEVNNTTTADDLLLDVEAALHEMACQLCVPRSVAALAVGHVLPPLGSLEQAIRAATAATTTASPAEPKAGKQSLSDRYVAAVRQLKSSCAFLSPDAVRKGKECVWRAAHSDADSLVFSVVPRLSRECSDTLAVVSASTAAASAASSRMLARDDAPGSSPVPHNGDDDAQNKATLQHAGSPHTTGSGRSAHSLRINTSFPHNDVAAGETVGSNRHSSPHQSPSQLPRALSSSPSSPAGDYHHKNTTVPSDGDSGAVVAGAVAGSLPPLLPPSSTPVVALEDVDVPSFRRLQAHRALILSREEAMSGSAAAYGASGGFIGEEEQQRLQPTLPWAAIEAAIQTEQHRLQAEHVLTGAYEKPPSSPSSSVFYAAHTKGMRDAFFSEGGSNSAVSALEVTRCRLRAAWLQRVQAEASALAAETSELSAATEKAKIWRAALKDKLRMEIEELEAESTRQAAVLSEREVLRSRVEQLQAQVAAAQTEERALLQPATIAEKDDDAEGLSRKADAAATPTAEAVDEAAAVTNITNSTNEEANAEALEVPSAAAVKSSSSSSDAASSASDAPPPPPPLLLKSTDSTHSSLHLLKGKAAKSTHTDRKSEASQRSRNKAETDSKSVAAAVAAVDVGGSGVGEDRRRSRWCGRREPLTHSSKTLQPSAAAADAERVERPRSRSRLSIERSFISPSLQEEVRAALESEATSDDETQESDSHRGSSSSSNSSTTRSAATTTSSRSGSESRESEIVRNNTLSPSSRPEEANGNYYRQRQQHEDRDHATKHHSNTSALRGSRKVPSDDAWTPSPAPQPTSRRRRYQRKEKKMTYDEADIVGASEEIYAAHRPHYFSAVVTPLRTAPTTAFSPSPEVPSSHLYSGMEPHRSMMGNSRLMRTRNGNDDDCVYSAQRKSLQPVTSIPSQQFSSMYEDATSAPSLYAPSHLANTSDDYRRQPSLPPSSPHLLSSSQLQRREKAKTHGSAADELREVTSALRRHIREPQPDPAEGQRLLQQVRELRREIEREEPGSARHHDADDRDADEVKLSKERSDRKTTSAGRGDNAATAMNFADPRSVSFETTSPLQKAEFRGGSASASRLYNSRFTGYRRSAYE